MAKNYIPLEQRRETFKKILASMTREHKQETETKRLLGLREAFKAETAEHKNARLQKSSKTQTGKPQTAIGRAADEHNLGAKRWFILSPHNVMYECVNLSHFIREHSEMFAPADVKWVTKTGKLRNMRCNANSGLRNVASKGGSWKDWRVAKNPEILHVIQAQRKFDPAYAPAD